MKDSAPDNFDPDRLTAMLDEALKDFSRPAPCRVRRTGTKRDVIEKSREVLLSFIGKHALSLNDLILLLAQCGLSVHKSTLKRHLGPVGRPRAKPQRSKQPTSHRSPKKGTARQDGNRPSPSASRAPAPPAVVRSPMVPTGDVPDGELPCQADTAIDQYPPVRAERWGRFIPRQEVPYSQLLLRSAEDQPPEELSN